MYDVLVLPCILNKKKGDKNYNTGKCFINMVSHADAIRLMNVWTAEAREVDWYKEAQGR